MCCATGQRRKTQRLHPWLQSARDFPVSAQGADAPLLCQRVQQPHNVAGLTTTPCTHMPWEDLTLEKRMGSTPWDSLFAKNLRELPRGLEVFRRRFFNMSSRVIVVPSERANQTDVEDAKKRGPNLKLQKCKLGLWESKGNSPNATPWRNIIHVYIYIDLFLYSIRCIRPY